MVDGPKRTVMAQQALALSDLINMRFEKHWVGSDVLKHLVVRAPEETTDGGKRARQAIVLCPAEGSVGTIMVGFLDVAQKKAELRGHAVLVDQYPRRYQSPFDVSRVDYDAMMRELQSLLGMQGFEITIEELVPVLAPEPTRGWYTPLMIASVVLFALLSLAAFVRVLVR